MISFTAEISFTGLNPHIVLPTKVYSYILSKAGTTLSRIPVYGRINNYDFNLTLVKSINNGVLYLSESFRNKAGIKAGEMLNIEIDFYKKHDRNVMHEKLEQALNDNEIAKLNFERLTPTRKKAMIHFINNRRMSGKIDLLINDLIERLNKRQHH